LARRADISMKVVQRLETGDITDPHYTTLVRLAGALGMSLAELVGESEPVAPGKAPRRSSPSAGEERPSSLGEEGYFVYMGNVGEPGDLLQMMEAGLWNLKDLSRREVMEALERAGIYLDDRKRVLAELTGSPVETEARRGSASR